MQQLFGKGRVVVAGLGVWLLIAATPAQASRTEEVTYVNGGEAVAHALIEFTTGVRHTDVVCPRFGDGSLPHHGGGCFDIQPGDSAIELTVADVSGRQIGGAIRFEDGDGETIGAKTQFCNDIAIAIPAGAATARIALENTTISCGPETGGIATTGTLTASFS